MIPPHLPLVDGIIEITYTLIILALVGLIVYKTREAYSVLEHEGIKYFLYAIFSFGIFFLFRFLIQIFIIATNAHQVMRYIGPAAAYPSLVGILYLAYAIGRKKFSLKKPDRAIHIASLLIVLIAFAINMHFFIIIIHLLILFAILLYMLFLPKKHVGSLVLYPLLIIFALLNFGMVRASLNFSPFKYPIYGLSVLIFIYLTYRVVRKLG